MKPVLLFDVDLTLFNTEKFKAAYPKSIASHFKISHDQFLIIGNEYRASLKKHTDYNISDYLKSISKRFNLPLYELKQICFSPENFACLYPDTLPTLSILSSKYRLGIFSEGFKIFQTTKLKLSGIYHLFNPELIYIFRRKTTSASLAKLPRNSTIIDDNLKVIESLLASKLTSSRNLKPIWLNRKNHPVHPGVHTINSLASLTT